MTGFTITTRGDGDGDGTVRLLLTGEIDMANADQIPAATEKALDGRPARIIIDLAGVSFLDSSGLRNLLTAHRIAADNNADLHVANAAGAALRVLTLTGLLDVLNSPEPDA